MLWLDLYFNVVAREIEIEIVGTTWDEAGWMEIGVMLD